MRRLPARMCGRMVAAGEIKHAQIKVALWIEGYLGNDANTHAQFHIGFDNVGIKGRQHNVRCEPGCLERLLNRSTTGEAWVISDDRMAGNGSEG